MSDIYIIDGSSLVYRSFHAIKDLKTTVGHPTNAIYGFVSAIFKLLKEKKTDYVVIVFDLKGPTIRHEIFVDYKATRKPMPDELAVQLPTIKKILNLLGIKIVEEQGYEGDDLIATLTKNLKSNNKIYIVTSDKDMLQLLDENVLLMNPKDGSLTDVNKFKLRYGVEPNKIVDIIGLAGDVSDNIPGLSGVGEKTAIKLIKEFGGVDGIFNSIDKVTPEKLRKKLLDGKEDVYLGVNLGRLIDDIILDISLKDIKVKELDVAELLNLFEKLEFRKLSESIKKEYLTGNEHFCGENIIGFSTGEVFEFTEIKNNIPQFKEICESPNIEKYGAKIKEKIIELQKVGINLDLPFFDISIAEHLTGELVIEKNLFLCKEKYMELLNNLGLKKLFDEVEIPLIKTLAWLETNGIKTDKAFLQNFSAKLQKDLEILQDKIYYEAGEVFNINSTQQLAHILFEKLGLPVIRKTKTSFSTDNAVLKELLNLHPIIEILIKYRETYKLNSTYTDGLIPYISAETGRIHPTYSQTTTSTGRLSCSNPNLQNIPIRTEKGSEIRKAFCVEKGNILYSFDYSQIELRILAHFSEDPYLLDAFQNDRDIHQETAHLLFPEDSLFNTMQSVGKIEDLRRVAKIINFGIIYGMSPYGLSQELNISLAEANNFIKEYFFRFKGVKSYIEKTIEFVEKNGYVYTILNRRRYITEIQNNNKKRKEFGRRAAINMPIQGSAADLMKMAMNQVYDYFKREKLKSKMILQVHDELLFEVAPEDEKSVYTPVKKIMENVIPLKVPLRVDAKKGLNYLDMVPIKE